MNLEKKLDMLTKMTKEHRSTVFKWNAKQEEAHIHLMFEKQKNHYFKISNEKEEKSTLYQAALYLSAEELYDTHRSLNTKNRTRSIDEIKDLTKAQARQYKKHTRKGEKTEKLLNLKTKLLTLIDEEDFTYKDVRGFLKRFHTLEVSITWIGIIYNRIKA